MLLRVSFRLNQCANTHHRSVLIHLVAYIFTTFFCSNLLLAQNESLRFQRITTAQGLSQNTIFAIAQDQNGFLWLGTLEGLDRYDGYGFKHYKHHADDPDSLSNNFVKDIEVDSQGRMWIATAGGLDLFDPSNERFVRYIEPDNKHGLIGNSASAIFVSLSGRIWVGTDMGLNRYQSSKDEFLPIKLDHNGNDAVAHIAEDSNGNLWLATDRGLVRYNHETGRAVRYQENNSNLPGNRVSSLLPDGSGGMWVGTYEGLARYRPETNEITEVFLSGQQDTVTPTGVGINCIYKDGDGQMWVGTRSNGLNRYDPKSQSFILYESNPMDTNSISHNGIISLLHDRHGILWVGTDMGLNKFDPRTLTFGLHRKLSRGNPKPGSHDIRSICTTPDNEVWLGTYGQGITRYSPATGEITQYQHEPDNPQSLEGHIIWMVRPDSEGNLWIGGDSGLCRLPPDRTNFVHYPTKTDVSNGISHGTTYTFYEDHKGRRWIGTFRGLNEYLGEEEGFRSYFHNPNNPNSLSSDNIWTMAEAPGHKIWVGTGGRGLDLFDPETGSAQNVGKQGIEPDTLRDGQIYCLLPDQRGQFLWLGTHAGLSRTQIDSPGSFETFDEQDGLPSSIICGLQEDLTGNIWVSTKNGLAVFSPKDGLIQSYALEDGLQSNEFNENAAWKDKHGRLYFAGTGGYNAFFPSEIALDTIPPSIKITELLLFNDSVKLRRVDPKSPLSKPILYTRELNLDHEDKMVSFELSPLHLAHPEQNKLAYRLDGHDEQWIYTDVKRRYATYTSLAPGEYAFRAKAANRDGQWGDEVFLKVKIAPPPWKTIWAYIFYALLCLLFLFWYLRLVRSRLEKERQIAEHIKIAAEKDQAIAEQERKTAQRLREVDRLKDEFLANTSHELRTPLNGIIGLAETLLDGNMGPITEEAKTNLELIVSSGKRLSTLVNDILDFSQLKNSTLQLNRKAVDSQALVQVVVSLLRPLADRKNLSIENLIPDDIPLIDADEVRLQQVFYNLINNALKFSHAGGVKITAHIIHSLVEFEISDTGVGIPDAKLNRIFESFEQVDGSVERAFSGSGLGLAITQRLVNLHGGRIKITSVVNRGTRVSVTMPVATGVQAENLEKSRTRGRVLESRRHSAAQKGVPQLSNTQLNEGVHILVVDDEPINRRILVSLLLAENFRLTEADDGPTALKILEMHRDIDMVLLDIMMPRMSGYEVCRHIREKKSVHELPVIILTAKNQQEDLVCGFESGANDYLVKPVAKTELVSRVRTHLSLLHANRNLEKKVQERTQELSEKNEEIVRTQQQLVVQEKMVSLGILTAGISHEINNPTNFVYAGVQNLKADLDKFMQFLMDVSEEEDPEIMGDIRRRMITLKEHAGIIMQGAGRIRGIVRDLHTFSRKDEAVNKTVRLVDNLRSTINLVSAQFHNRVAFSFHFEDPIEINCQPAELNQVFLNMVVNGCQAIITRLDAEDPTGIGTMTLSTRLEDGMGVVEFADSGCGIPEEVREHIFEPFFTTREVGEGTGLGLSISYGIVQKHGGYIEVESAEGEGSVFRIKLPMEESPLP